MPNNKDIKDIFDQPKCKVVPASSIHLHKMAESQCKTEPDDSVIMTSALACAIKFLQRYPELTHFVINKSSYQFDIHSLIVDAKRMNLEAAVEDIRKEFTTNGTSCELCDENESSSLGPNETPDAILRNHQSEDDHTDNESTKLEDPVNEASECDILQDVTNYSKKGLRRNFRKNKSKNSSLTEHCVFCLNNGATRAEYESHHCKDEWGNVTCPVLQKFVCSRCKATGTNAHTAKYCPQKPIITPEDCVAIEKRWEQKRRRRLVLTKGANDQSKPTPVTKAASRLRL